MVIRLEVQADVKGHFVLEELKAFQHADGGIYAIVAHNRDLRLIHDFWVGDFDDQAAFRAVLTFILEQLRTGAYSLWLADIRHMSRSFMASNQWMVNELVPQLFEAGLEREAVVVPPRADVPQGFDVFGAATAALREIADGRIRGFTDVEAAKRWLLEGVLPPAEA